MDPSHLKAELARLRKGRGVSRPDLLAVLGPTLRAILDVDDTTWNRARGFALHQAAMIIPYNTKTNPGFVAMAKRTVEEVLTNLL